MITGAELNDARQPLLDDELLVIDEMPAETPAVSAGEVAGEGPLALDYRTWDEQVVEDGQIETPRMDVTYDLAYRVVNYDGSGKPKKYTYAVHNVSDK
jgi:hypothetical protein